jgi:hypothetical protein
MAYFSLDVEPMPKFRALIKGENVLIHSQDLQRVAPSGFYVRAFVDAPSHGAAENKALELVRQSHVYGAARNAADDPPRLAVEEIVEILDWPADTVRPLTGFALYDEGT